MIIRQLRKQILKRLPLPLPYRIGLRVTLPVAVWGGTRLWRRYRRRQTTK